MLVMFLIGLVSMVIGVILVIKLVGGVIVLGDNYWVLVGMMIGIYIGGSVNFNVLVIYYEVMEEGNLYVGIVVVDNILIVLWMIVILLLFKLL